MGKQLFDFSSVLTGLIVLSPFFLVIAVIIKATSSGPIFFRQKRIGRDFRSFYIYKFRTMLHGASKRGPEITVSGDSRVTPFGKILRYLKFDELPQLFNVLKGEMSLVGPRPEVTSYVEAFKKDYEVILKVLPGITDLASVMFRDESALFVQSEDPEKLYLQSVLPRKIKLAKVYVQDRSFLFDLKILFATFTVLLFPSFHPSFLIEKSRKENTD